MNPAREAISEGSKSFFLASLFFSEPVRRDVWSLYRWCRYCDDQVDLAGHPECAKAALDVVRSRTVAALSGERGDVIFSDLGEICSNHAIPSRYPLELLDGFNKDARFSGLPTLADVEEYSYQVAGVVGLMMTSIMGGKDPAAAPHAIALGNAMQLTNIARDVAEDFGRGRIYLPSEWLAEEGVPTNALLAPEHRATVYRLVNRLLDRADALYQEGLAGLKYLPLRSAVAVAAAGAIYSRIGMKIRRGGPRALDTRAYVSLSEKIALACRGLFQALRSRI